MQDLKTQVQNLAPEEWQAFLGWVVGEEKARRDAQPAVEEAQAQLVEQLWEARPELKPEAGAVEITPAETEEELIAQVRQWEQPATPLDGYQRAELTALDGRIWRNRRPGNTKRPGTPFSGWEDVTAEYLKLADAQDGNAEDADTTDAPGLITQPEPEPSPQPEKVTPAPMAQPWKAGEWYSAGELTLDNGVAYVSQRLHRATDTNRPSTGAKEWQPLPA